MFSTDVAYAGAPVDAYSQPGTTIKVVGFRIVPVLAAGATKQQLLDAYSPLQVRITKQSQQFPTGTTESMMVAGPDWTACVGIGKLEILAGLNGTTYRVWLATDCKEMEFVEAPVMNGFDAAGASSGSTGSNVVTSEDQNLTAAAPSGGSDGVSIAGARAIRVSYKAKNAGATLNAAGKSDAYAYNGTRWIRMPELDYSFLAAGAAVVEPMATGPAPSLVVFNASLTRLQYVSNGMTVSAGTQVVRTIEVLT